jgi:hypothetical protein
LTRDAECREACLVTGLANVPISKPSAWHLVHSSASSAPVILPASVLVSRITMPDGTRTTWSSSTDQPCQFARHQRLALGTHPAQGSLATHRGPPSPGAAAAQQQRYRHTGPDDECDQRRSGLQ